MILTLLDGKEIVFDKPVNGYEAALAISPGLAKRGLAYRLNGTMFDLLHPITDDGRFELVTESDPVALDMLRHDASHLMAQALQELYPGVKFGFGPSIEEGFYYDFDYPAALSENDFPKIEDAMRRLAAANHPIRRQDVLLKEALEIFKDNPYKLELIKEIGANISVYRQGAFTDLCMGPHLPSTGYVKHFKLLSIAGAYWRGNSDNKQLTRIYGTAFFHKEDLAEYLRIIEQRKLRDHRRLGRELGLFMMSEFGPGFPFWLDKGLTLKSTLERFWYDVHRREGYEFVATPIMLSKELWEISGHWANYRANMYTSSIEEKDFAIKPMNCPGGMLVYKNSLHSYKDLPLRVGELGLVHRHEASGALSGLFRVRNFTQDDAHIYCRPEQLIDEVVRLLHLFDYFYGVFGLKYDVYLSTRPEKDFIGTVEIWDKSEKALAKACEKIGLPFKINPGDGAFYGPKLDYKLKDSMNRVWQCGTIQLDMNLPERFDLTYINENNEKVRPIMLHRAIYGSLERFIGILIEHFGGAFPLWLAPLQIAVLPVHQTVHKDYATKVAAQLTDAGFRVSIDASEEKLGYRLRQAQVQKIPVTLVVGDQEMNDGSVVARRYGSEEQTKIGWAELIENLSLERREKKLQP